MSIMDRVSGHYEKEAKNCNGWCSCRKIPYSVWFLLGLLFISFHCTSVHSDTMVQNGFTKKREIFSYNNSTNVCPHFRMEREAKRPKKISDEQYDDVDLETYVNPDEERRVISEKCMLREEIRQISLAMIKEDILSKLGMAHPPNLVGEVRPAIGEFGMSRLLEKFEMETKEKHHYTPRRHFSHHTRPGVHWVIPNDDSQMQGDAPAPAERNSADRDFSDKSNSVRSHVNNSDNRFSDSTSSEGEVIYLDEDDDFYVRTEKVVAFSLPHPKLRHFPPHVQYFQFSDKARANRVKRAVLWIYIRGRNYPGVSGNMVNITIYKASRSGSQPGRTGGESLALTPIICGLKESLPHSQGAWLSLEYGELERIVTEWFRNPQSNLGIVISALDRFGNNLAVTSHHGMKSVANVPFLEVYVTDMKKHRTKRTLGLTCNENSNETRCCRYPLTVDFEEFGWDWVIAPKKYEANFCAGECPMVFMPRYPHTTLVQLTNIHRSGAGPCCAPRKLSSISMLYFDNQMNVMYGTLPSMVVDRCGCS